MSSYKTPSRQTKHQFQELVCVFLLFCSLEKQTYSLLPNTHTHVHNSKLVCGLKRIFLMRWLLFEIGTIFSSYSPSTSTGPTLTQMQWLNNSHLKIIFFFSKIKSSDVLRSEHATHAALINKYTPLNLCRLTDPYKGSIHLHEAFVEHIANHYMNVCLFWYHCHNGQCHLMFVSSRYSW